MQNKIFQIIVFIQALLFISCAHAQTIVSAGNVNGTWTLANSPYQVQGLIVVQDGQTLTVEPGVKVEFATTGRLRIKGNMIASGTAQDTITFTAINQANGWQSIFMDSVNATSDSTIFEHCTIEYGKGTGLFRIINFSKVRIENCRLQNGQAFSGGCVYMANSDAIFKNNLITNNSAQSNGGAFVLGAGTPVFTGNTITYNVAGNWGGAFRIAATSNAIYSGNTISNNQALSGGAFNMTSFCTLTIDGNVFDSNQSTYDGAVFWGGNEFLTVTNNSFTNNISGEDGGIAFFQSYTNSTFSGNYYSGNSAERGGAFYVMSNSQLHFFDETYHANSSSSSGSVVYATGDCVLTFENSKMSNNTGSVCLVLSGDSYVTTKNCLFANNQGVAVSVSSSSGVHTNTNFVNNEVTPAVGVLITSSGSNSTFTNCIFKGNVGGGAFYNGYVQYNGWNPSSASFINCNIEGGIASIDADGGPPPVYTNNIDADPLFVAPSAGPGAIFDGLNADWQIGTSSPCFNAGLPDTTGLSLPSTDLAGGVRVVLDTVDIGAYEIFLEAQVLAASSNVGVCLGDSAVISVQAGGVDPFSYQWQFNGADIAGATADSLSIFGSAPNAGNYRCIVSNSFGEDTSNLIAVTLNNPPVLNSLGVDTAFCPNTSLTLLADLGNYTYDWNLGISTADSLVVSAVGDYFYSVVDNNGCTAASDTISVTQFALPNVMLEGDTACVGETIVLFSNQPFVSYNWNNGASVSDSIVAFSTGQYFLEVVDSNNCTASDTAELLFHPLPLVDLGGDQAICPGDSTLLFAPVGMVSYDWNAGLSSADSMYANAPGDWFVSVIDSNGCLNADTVLLTNLSVSAGTDFITACESYTWIDGNTYTSSNNSAQWVLNNAFGCDSIVTLDLTINAPNSGTDIITACETYAWIDGNTYSTSNNTATHVLTNAQGCDSTVTLDLTILNATAGTDVISECESYTWIDGNNYTSSNNSAIYTLTNSLGCDSIVTLDLTILNATTGTETVSTCNDFTWIDGNTYSTSTTATYTFVGGAANGCDSVVTLDLTISPLNISVTNNDPELIAPSGMTSYQWLDCDNNFAPINGETSAALLAQQNGLYAVQVEENGCVDTSSCFVINQVSLLEQNTTNWTISPNPTKGKITIDFQEPIGDVVLEVCNPLGQIVSIESFNSSSTFELNLNGESGLYFIRILTDGRLYSLPAIKF